MQYGEVTAEVDGPFSIFVETTKDVCYAVLKDMEMISLDPQSLLVTGSVK